MDFKNEILMMSEEEVRNRAKELLNENQVDLITKYMFLEQQCKKQKEVIDNAREKLIELAKNFKQEAHIGTAYDDDIFYEELFEIFKEVE